MMRAAITGPIPGIILNSFSVAILTSILPNSGISFACDFLGSPLSPGGIGAVGFGVDERMEGEAGVARRRPFSAGTKTLKEGEFAGRTFNRPATMPHAPIFSCLAWS